MSACGPFAVTDLPFSFASALRRTIAHRCGVANDGTRAFSDKDEVATLSTPQEQKLYVDSWCPENVSFC